MKNINLILNILSLAAIAVLFIFQFQKKSDTQQGNTSTKDQNEEQGFSPVIKNDSLSVSLAYVNIDTIEEYYYYYKQLEKKYEKSTKLAMQGLEKKKKELQAKIEEIESKVMLGMKTQEEAQQEAYKLQLDYQDFYESQQKILAKREQEGFAENMDSLRHHVELFNKTAGFDYIISQASFSSLLYASPSLDVTKQVLESMNKSGKKEEE